MWFDSFVIPSDAPHPDAAHAFIDFMMRPEVAAANSNYVFYASGNLDAQPLLSEDVISDEAVYPSQETLDRLFTSIHLSDDLDQGFSHFYNEMMRIKQISEALSAGEKCFVIVDELFRGTNQEDALHCSKTVLDGFANFNGSCFLVSTHLHELITHYTDHPRLSFRCFRTRITGNQFENTFKIEEGAAFEKVGRLIMEQTGVTALLHNAKRPSSE